MNRIIKITEYVIGVDEVGLGALAGPLVVCALATPRGWRGLPGLDDSKEVNEADRKRLSTMLWTLIVRKHSFATIVRIDSKRIDEEGVGRVHRRAIEEVIKDLMRHLRSRRKLVADVIVDGNLNFSHVHPRVRSVVKADGKFNCVRGASILAKVFRDREMEKLGEAFPLYGFEKHKGYPTKEHYAALDQHGPGEHHRYSYGPVRSRMKNDRAKE